MKKRKFELIFTFGGTALGISGIMLVICASSNIVLCSIGVTLAALTLPCWSSAIALGFLALMALSKKINKKIKPNNHINKEHVAVEYWPLAKDHCKQNEYENSVMKNAKGTFANYVPNTTQSQTAKNISENNSLQR